MYNFININEYIRNHIKQTDEMIPILFVFSVETN